MHDLIHESDTYKKNLIERGGGHVWRNQIIQNNAPTSTGTLKTRTEGSYTEEEYMGDEQMILS